MNDSCLVPSTQISITIELNVREPVFFHQLFFSLNFLATSKFPQFPKRNM